MRALWSNPSAESGLKHRKAVSADAAFFLSNQIQSVNEILV